MGSKNKIVTIVGTRPQFIKMALVSKALKQKRICEIIIHTGQHYDANLSEVFLRELNIPIAKYNLGVGAGTHGQQTARMILGIEKILFDEKPDTVLVYGDTNSTLAGALAAAKLKIRIAHVEAGLRSFNLRMPEEINRVITDRISSIFFCPTRTSVFNLKKENIIKNVFLVGDVMYDSLRNYLDYCRQEYNQEKGYILCTIHRAENTDCRQRLKNIFKALSLIENKIILPLHPRTEKLLRKYNIKKATTIKVIKPVGYFEMLSLERQAKVIMTDSGGVQKEAFIFNIPCITLREETEWVETVKSRMNVLTDVDIGKILRALRYMPRQRKRIDAAKFYGDGFAHVKIAEILSRKIKGD